MKVGGQGPKASSSCLSVVECSYEGRRGGGTSWAWVHYKFCGNEATKVSNMGVHAYYIGQERKNAFGDDLGHSHSM